MCIIIIKQDGKLLPSEVVKTSARINPHGLGIIWLDTYEVSYHKSSEHKVLNTKRPFIAHFRWASVGKVCKANTHPFRCGDNKHEWLMMNGTIRGLGDTEKSDTRVLAETLGTIPRNKWKAELGKYDSRFVTVNTRNRSYQIYNKHLWTIRDGVWYSKGNVLEDHIIAVYGTLKKGYTNYRHYLVDSKYVGKGKTKDKYPLIIQGLPYLINEKGVGHHVEVDVFRVDDETMMDLDRLEGHPRFYCRRKTPIKMSNGSVVTCWVYFSETNSHEGKMLHKSYTQDISKHWQLPEPEPETEQVADDIIGEDCTDCTPVCVNCYHDLEYDYFSNYYCKSCGDWFKENEIIKFRDELF